MGPTGGGAWSWRGLVGGVWVGRQPKQDMWVESCSCSSSKEKFSSMHSSICSTKAC